MTDAAVYFAELCRLYVLVTLAVAVAGKAVGFGPFRVSIAELFGLSRGIARYVAYPVIGTEALIAALLLAGGNWAWVGMASALMLFLAFTAVILVVLMQRRAVRCNCFGGRGHRISVYDLLRNGSLIAAAGCYIRCWAPAMSPEPTAFAPLLGIALILFLISAYLRDILSLSRWA